MNVRAGLRNPQTGSGPDEKLNVSQYPKCTFSRRSSDMTGDGFRYCLASHAYCCEVEDGAIILDIRTGNYMGVAAEHLQSLRESIRNWPDLACFDGGLRSDYESSSALIENLIHRGIVTASTGQERASTACQATSAQTIFNINDEPHVIPFVHIGRFLLAFGIVKAFYVSNQVTKLLSRLQSYRTPDGKSTTDSSAETRRLLRSFMHLRIWFYTADQQCLMDSLVLHLFLTFGATRCTFTIGVSTKPFLAHSWVQMEDRVVNDSAEHVNMFKTILAIDNFR